MPRPQSGLPIRAPAFLNPPWVRVAYERFSGEAKLICFKLNTQTLCPPRGEFKVQRSTKTATVNSRVDVIHDSKRCGLSG
jgi:hypothetical protein